jgi:hypothetical protein
MTLPNMPPLDQQAWAALVARNVEMDPQLRVKRGEDRYDVPFGHVTIHFRNEDCRPFTATLLDVSLTGLMLRTFEEMPNRTATALHICVGDDECVVHAKSIHCTGTLAGYKVGFELQFPAPAESPAAPAEPLHEPAEESASIAAPATPASSERSPARRTLLSWLFKRPGD